VHSRVVTTDERTNCRCVFVVDRTEQVSLNLVVELGTELRRIEIESAEATLGRKPGKRSPADDTPTREFLFVWLQVKVVKLQLAGCEKSFSIPYRYVVIIPRQAGIQRYTTCSDQYLPEKCTVSVLPTSALPAPLLRGGRLHRSSAQHDF
jgi:hypothetical protein